MSHDNKAIVIHYQMAVTERLKTGSGDDFQQYLHQDVRWHLPQSMQAFGGSVFQGIDGVTQMLTQNIHRFYQPDSIKADFRSMIGEGDFVHIHFGMSATTANGKAYRNDYQTLYQLHDGKILNVWEYFDAHHLIACIR